MQFPAMPPIHQSPTQLDRRTRSGRRKEILDHIQLHEGFSIFWITEHRLRAVVGMEMQKTGEIITDNKTYGYPWIGVKISPIKN
jgi:hypothetical protein